MSKCIKLKILIKSYRTHFAPQNWCYINFLKNFVLGIFGAEEEIFKEKNVPSVFRVSKKSELFGSDYNKLYCVLNLHQDHEVITI